MCLMGVNILAQLPLHFPTPVYRLEATEKLVYTKKWLTALWWEELEGWEEAVSHIIAARIHGSPL